MSTLYGQASVKRKPNIFDGKAKTIVVHGYSTSRLWPPILQRKLNRYFGRKGVIEVRRAIKGGTPIAKWMSVKSFQPLPPWNGILLPAMRQSGDRPVIVLAQQSLQFAFGERGAGIRNDKDSERIKFGARVIQRYAEQLLKDGAAHVFVAMHIYKKGMEPEIGNERLALAEYMKSEPNNVSAGPDVWDITRKLWPIAFAADEVHPNQIGAEVMAHRWFETLLTCDGREVPKWSEQEMLAAIKVPPEDAPRPDSSQNRGDRPAAQSRDMSYDGIASRHDHNGDGKITRREFRGLSRVFDQLDRNQDDVLTRDDFNGADER